MNHLKNRFFLSVVACTFMPNPVFATHIYWDTLPSIGVWSILEAKHLKETGSSSPRSYELPTALQLRVELTSISFSHARILSSLRLNRSCAYCNTLVSSYAILPCVVWKTVNWRWWMTTMKWPKFSRHSRTAPQWRQWTGDHG